MLSRLVLLPLILSLFTVSGCRIAAKMNIPTGGPYPEHTADAPASDPSLSEDATVAAFSSLSDTLVAGDGNGVADVFVRSGNITTLISAGGNGASTNPRVAADGSVVAFVSEADNLVAGDTNGVADIFIADLTTLAITRVSLGAGGAQANGASSEPAISDDGRYVVFTSLASNLVGTNDTNGVSDVFVHDRTAGTTTRVSVTAGGAQANGASRAGDISPSGDWVAFESDATNLVGGDSNGVTDVFAATRTGGTVLRMSAPDALGFPFQQSNGPSTDPVITDPLNGFIGGGEPLVVYTSGATNLAGSDNNGAGTDVFATTRLFGALFSTTRLSDAVEESHSPSVAVVDGGPAHVTAFVTGGDIISTLRNSPVDLGGINAQTVTTAANGAVPNGSSAAPALSGNGRFLAFATTMTNFSMPNAAPSVGDVVVVRTRDVIIDAVDDPFISVGETRQFTVTGSGFDEGATALFDGGIEVDSVSFVSSTELVVTATGTSAEPGVDFRDLVIIIPGVNGGIVSWAAAACLDCIEIAAVVDQGGPVDIEITGGSVQIETLTLPLPSCLFGFCPALPANVGFDGVLGFGVSSIELDSIELPVELIPGIETTVGLALFFDAPSGAVIPANGTLDLSFGFGIRIINPLLPSSCAIGPVGASLSASNPGGVAYDQTTGEATLAGSFTEELAITGCGLFTGILNGLLGLPSPIANNELILNIRMDPILTGSIVP